MFPFVTSTHNIVVGCKHDCVYCWAKALAEGKLKRFYGDFSPRFLEKRCATLRPKQGECVFLSDMGDLWGEWVPENWIRIILQLVRMNGQADFLFMTKNPERYLDALHAIPNNTILGCTVETNLDELTARVSKAPVPSERFASMRSIQGYRTMLSLEPIMKFEPEGFLNDILDIKPSCIAVGYDNYDNHLPEPPLNEVKELIANLRAHEITVYEKTIREPRN
jgi:DNA repair photolyase